MKRMKHEQGLVFYHQNKLAEWLIKIVAISLLVLGIFYLGAYYEKRRIFGNSDSFIGNGFYLKQISLKGVK